MLYDNISNIKTYKGLSEDIYAGLLFLQEATPDTANGVYQINPRVKAIVSEYETKPQNQNGYEAHRQYIDIQYLITGTEKICCLPLEYLKETKSYKEDIDAAFYVEANVRPQELLMGNGYFAILYPQDGHMPQLSVTDPVLVKKVVVKVKV